MTEDKAWFAPRRYGYGTGLPIAWQGWALLGVFLALIWGATALAGAYPKPVVIGGSMAVVVVATLAFILYAKRRTRGGWRWRWGD